MLKTWFAVLIFTCAFASASVVAASDEPYFAGQQPSLAQLQQAQTKAAAEDKLLMLVLGADWCHDSQALMAHFSEAEFKSQLQQRFVVQAYDVGFVERGFNVTEAYGQPTYYGTPTVMVIDPETGQVLNKADWQHWTNAASHNADDFNNYFLEGSFTAPAPNNAWQQRVQAFEAQQARRVRAGFQAVSPLMQAYMASDRQEASAEFMALWSELADFRNKVFDATVKLSQQTEATELPQFAPQSWEKSAQ